MNSSTVVLATSVVIAAGAVYAYKNNMTYGDVLDKFKENKPKFEALVENLIASGRELLERLYQLLLSIINTFKNKYLQPKREI
jgi:hypothetical protein